MADRIRINMQAVMALLREPGVQAEVERQTRRVDANTTAQGVQTRVDFQTDERPRGAVIAGYEDGATAENTRRALLRALHFGGGA
jgi:hypothetical protein